MDDMSRMETMPVSKAIFLNAVPAIMAMLMVLIYNLADTFFIGKTNDGIQIAAVSLTTPVFLIFTALGTVFGMGGTSVISRAFGEGRRDYAKKVSAFCMWGCVIMGTVSSVLLVVFLDPLLKKMGASEDVFPYAADYLRIVALCGPFSLISNCFANVLRAKGQSGKAMMGQLIGNLINVVLDPIFILTLHLNVKGAAIATVIGNFIGAGYYILYFLRGRKPAQRFTAGFYGEGESADLRPGHWHSGIIGGLADVRFPNGGKRHDDRLRRYGCSRVWRCVESKHDRGYFWLGLGAGRCAAAGV